MSLEKVENYFSQWNLQGRILQFPVSSATVELAAIALNCAPARIAKTLSFKVEDRAILVVTAGDAKIDNSKFKSRFHLKAKMLQSEEVEPLTGHPVGGVCPFGVNEEVAIYLDDSLKRFTTVFPACGTGNSAIELSIAELEKYTRNATWVDVCKI